VPSASVVLLLHHPDIQTVIATVTVIVIAVVVEGPSRATVVGPLILHLDLHLDLAVVIAVVAPAGTVSAASSEWLRQHGPL